MTIKVAFVCIRVCVCFFCNRFIAIIGIIGGYILVLISLGDRQRDRERDNRATEKREWEDTYLIWAGRSALLLFILNTFRTFLVFASKDHVRHTDRGMQHSIGKFLDYINYDKSIFGTISHSKNRKYSICISKNQLHTN